MCSNQWWTAHSRREDHVALRSTVRSLSLRWSMAKGSHHFFGWGCHRTGLHQCHTGEDSFAAKQPRLNRKTNQEQRFRSYIRKQASISNDVHLRKLCESYDILQGSLNWLHYFLDGHRQHPEWHKTANKVIWNHFGVFKTNPFHMVADWAAGQMGHCCGICERRDRGGDKVIQRSVSQDGRAGGKAHPPHSSSIKTENAGETETKTLIWKISLISKSQQVFV